jgi:solute carrier family 6 amino acid transporter-like protein 5/7/9/14
MKNNLKCHAIFYFVPAAFFLVYIIVLLLVGVPLYVLEVVMAQYSSLGPIHVYRCLPLFTGRVKL